MFCYFQLKFMNFYSFYSKYHLKFNFLVHRGSLYFCNKTIGTVTVNGLEAYLSSLACSKVQEEALLFPEVLRADLLPRSMVWPNSFKYEGPTDQSIALYFFPKNERWFPRPVLRVVTGLLLL